MKMRKIILAALTTCALAMSSFGTAFANSWSADWDVTFDNSKQMASNYDQAKINAEIDEMQPGDDLTLDISIKNDSSDSTEWYMTSTVLRTLEDANTASGGAYVYRLMYDGNEIYSSETVGGDDSQGLHEVDDATGSWLYLASLAPGQGGNVQLYMALDGATQENDYMTQAGGLQINFAVEEAGQPTRNLVVGDLLQTGDTLTTVLMFAVCAVLIALTALSFWRDRTKARAFVPYTNAGTVEPAKNESVREGGDE